MQRNDIKHQPNGKAKQANKVEPNANDKVHRVFCVSDRVPENDVNGKKFVFFFSTLRIQLSQFLFLKEKFSSFIAKFEQKAFNCQTDSGRRVAGQRKKSFAHSYFSTVQFFRFVFFFL